MAEVQSSQKRFPPLPLLRGNDETDDVSREVLSMGTSALGTRWGHRGVATVEASTSRHVSLSPKSIDM